MPKRRVFVHAAAAVGPHGDVTPAERRALTADAKPSDLRERVKALTGQHLRQASHFVELAVVGAKTCLNRLAHPADPGTAIYLGSGLAEQRKTQALFKQVAGGGLASPFDFINAANNMAAFYVAKLAGLSARNYTVMTDEVSFETALATAFSDVAHGAVPAALVGGMDECLDTRAEQLRRLDLNPTQHIGEGGGWLYLSPAEDGALAELLVVEEVADASAWVNELRQGAEAVTWLHGFHTAQPHPAHPEQRAQDRVYDYLKFCGCFHTAAAFGVASLFDDPANQGLYLHSQTGRHGDWHIGLRLSATTR